MKKRTSIRLLSLLLCLAMLLGNLPSLAFAAEDDNLCEHHPAHTAECGYGVDSPCTFRCTECEWDVVNEADQEIDSTEIETEEFILVKTVDGTMSLPATEVEVPFQVNPRYQEEVNASSFDLPEDDAPLIALMSDYLTEAEAAVQVREYMVNRVEAFTVFVKTTNSDFSGVCNSLFDRALAHTGAPTQGDYLAWQYGGWGCSGSYGSSAGTYYYTFSFTVSYYTTAAQEEIMDARVSQLLGQLNLSGKSDYEKIKGVYDYICENVTYDYGNLNISAYKLKYTAYAALVNGTSVCQGYSALLYRLALELGISCRVIPGDGGGPHAWNIIRMGDYYYNADATWDAGRNVYCYFLVSPSNFTDHTRNWEYDTDSFHAAYPMGSEDYDPSEDENMIARGSCGENVTYTLTKDGVLTISGSSTMANYGGNSRSPWYNHRSDIFSIAIMDGVTSIGENAFDGLSSLTSITIPNSVATIGNSAFSGCASLEIVNYGGTEDQWNVISIGSNNDYLLNAERRTKEIAENSCGDNLLYTISDGGVLTISGSQTMWNFNSDSIPWKEKSSDIISVVITDGVTSIGDYAFFECRNLTAISIPNSVTYIGSSAFASCVKLSSITIPAGVPAILDCSFYNCASLASVTLPKNLKEICDKSFTGCENLTSISIPAGVYSIGKYAFSACTKLTTVSIPDSVTVIGSNAFSYCHSLDSVSIPDNVNFIGGGAFFGCISLTSISLPKNLETIRDGLLCGCYNLTSITIPDGVTSVGKNAFDGCYGVSSISIPDSVSYIGKEAFKDCRSLTTITLPKKLEKIEEKLFWGCHSLTSIIIPDGIVSIGNDAFRACYELDSVPIPNSVTSIGDSAFYDCALSTITLPTNLKSIGSEVFSRCSLEYITIPEGVISIGNGAFSVCTSLASVTIPNSVTSIENSAFKNCYSLQIVRYGGTRSQWDAITIDLDNDYLLNARLIFQGEEINGKCGENLAYSLSDDGVLTISGTGSMWDFNSDTIPWGDFSRTIRSVLISESVTSIGSYAFYECSRMKTITIPDNISFIGCWAFYHCQGLSTVTLPSGLETIEEYLFRDCTFLTSVNLPEGVTSIGNGAFSVCTGLTSITIPVGVTSIGDKAFDSCISLTDITIPENVTFIGKSAFADCSSLTSITIPEKVISIGGWAFSGCSSLTSITIPEGVTSIGSFAFSGCSSLASINIPEGVTFIGEGTFFKCSSLTDITIPESAASIGDFAFYDCSSLKTVYYSGAQEQWNSITIGSENKCLTNAAIVYGNPSAMMKLSLPKGTAAVEAAAFQDCVTLESVLIPASVKGIGALAFDGCTGLNAIVFSGSAPAIAADAFTGVRATVYYPENDRTWTSGIMQSYGGTLIWVPYAVK